MGDDTTFVAFILLVLALMTTSVMIGVWLEGILYSKPLATSICEQTYGEGAEYVSYEDKVLVCNPPKNLTKFDGIHVTIANGGVR